MTVPEIDVVILTWNDGALLSRAIASVQASLGVETTIVVVDNGSQPPAAVPFGVSLIRNEVNRGVAAARNQGARAGTAPMICFLDSDAVLHPPTLRRLADSLTNDSAVSLAAPVFTGQAPQASAGRMPGALRKIGRGLNLTHVYGKVPTVGDEWDVEFAIGACQLVLRSAYESVGGLDEKYFYGPEDIAFCRELRRQSFRLVQVNARCDHPPRRRNKRLLTRSGVKHAFAVLRFLAKKRT